MFGRIGVMAEAAVMGFQSQEYARASMMYSDLELAFQLQLNEALAASAATSDIASSSGSGVKNEALREQASSNSNRGGGGGRGGGSGGAGDRAMALSVQSRELRRRQQELIDEEKAQEASQGLSVEMQQRWHDKEFARSILEIPDEEWEHSGAYFEKPFLTTEVAAEDDEEEEEDDGGAWAKDQVCNLFFGRVREDSGHVGMAWAVTDGTGHVLFQQSKYLGRGISAGAANYTALINGLAYARSAGVRNIVAHGHSAAVSNQVSRQWRATGALAKFLEQVHEYEKQLDSLTVHVVPDSKNLYVINLARKVIQSHVANLAKNGVHVQVPSTGQESSEDCPICCESRCLANMFLVSRCSHKFCVNCLSQHVEVQVKANQVPVRCPLECLNHLDLDQCQPFLPPKVLESFAKCLTEASIPESDRVYCPFHNCSALMSKGGLNPSVMGSSSSHPHASSIGRCECMECHRLFCVECQVPWHAGLSCAEYQKLPPDERDAEDVKLYQLASNKNWQRCKKCRRVIELDQGCYHMTCRCGHEFCYTCGAEWKNKQATCKCKLWDENNIIEDDLSESEYGPSDSEDESEPEDRTGNIFYKTRICIHWQRGFCWAGDNCNFAHGQGDLRRLRL